MWLNCVLIVPFIFHFCIRKVILQCRKMYFWSLPGHALGFSWIALENAPMIPNSLMLNSLSLNRQGMKPTIGSEPDPVAIGHCPPSPPSTFQNLPDPRLIWRIKLSPVPRPAEFFQVPNLLCVVSGVITQLIFTGFKPAFLAASMPCFTSADISTPGDLPKSLRIQGIQTDIDPVQTS